MLGAPGGGSALTVVRRGPIAAVNVSERCARGVERRETVEQVLKFTVLAGDRRLAVIDPAGGIDVRLFR